MSGGYYEEAVVVPVVEEQAVVRKHRRITGAVQAHTTVHATEQALDVPVEHEEVIVERVSLDRLVDVPEQVRQEGDTTIIPVHEEVLVVEKRLKLVGEVRVTRRRTVREETHHLVLRREEVEVQRSGLADEASSA